MGLDTGNPMLGWQFIDLVKVPGDQYVVSKAQTEEIGAEGIRLLYLRGMDETAGTPIPGTEGAANPFFSPDGEWVGFVEAAGGTTLQKVSVFGGPPVTLTETPTGMVGLSWGTDDRIVFGGCDRVIHILDAKDGTPLHRVQVEGEIAATAALAGRRAVIGHYGNAVVCVDVHTGEELWTYSHRSFPFFSSAAVTDKLAVLGGRDRHLHAIDLDTGKHVWRFRARGNIDSSPVIVGGRVVVGSNDGRLYIVNLEDGAEIWSYDIGEAITSSPAVADGWVVVGCEDGNVYAFRPPLPPGDLSLRGGRGEGKREEAKR